MSSDKQFSIITCYHFNETNADAYKRLLQSLDATLREIGEQGRIILVANGTEDLGAKDPAQVVRELAPRRSARIEPVILRSNAGNTGGLNAGVAMALAFPLATQQEEEWIGSVQSSATLLPNWIENVTSCMHDPSVGAVFGRLLVENGEERVLNDGHKLCSGLTRDANYKKTQSEALDHGAFPCLSAVIFKKALVEAVVKRYGNFVCENLAYYGDCTDVTLRAIAADPKVTFNYSSKAEALKRRPILNQFKVQCSQLMASSLYYVDGRRREKAENRLKGKPCTEEFVDVVRQADERLRRPYSPIEKSAPAAPASLDKSWGAEPKSRPQRNAQYS